MRMLLSVLYRVLEGFSVKVLLGSPPHALSGSSTVPISEFRV